jgi:hypothetical protein
MHTPEAEARCADSNRRSPRKRAQLARLARAKIGVPVSEETRARQSRAQIYLSKLRRIRNRPKFSSSLFDERRIAELIVRWQRDGDGETFAEIIRASLPLINHLIYKYSAQSRDDFAEVRAEVILKLSKALLKFDPARGKAFTLYYFAIKRFLFSRFEKMAVRRSREVPTDPALMAERLGNWNSASDNWNDSFANWNEFGQPRRASEEFLERLRDLLRPQAWQWKWRWQPKGTLPLPEWRPEWKWEKLGVLRAA